VDACPICAIPTDRIWIETEHAIAFAAAEPATDGHMIVAPRKHVFTIYQLAVPEQQAVWSLVTEVRERLLTGLKPDGSSPTRETPRLCRGGSRSLTDPEIWGSRRIPLQ
jgi:diadenosine tetraphosphate (Ap4A) HIT family hydrolase